MIEAEVAESAGIDKAEGRAGTVDDQIVGAGTDGAKVE